VTKLLRISGMIELVLLSWVMKSRV